MITRRSFVLGSLVLLPVLIYVLLGLWALWETRLLLRVWWLLPSCWVLTWALARLWPTTRPGDQKQYLLAAPSHWTPRDRQAAEIVRTHQQKVEQLTALQLTDPKFYESEGHELATALARHYHPDATDPYSSLTVPEVLAAARLALDDMEQWMLISVPGSRLLTIKHWRMLQSAPLWYRRVQDTVWAASMLLNPLNIARYFSSKMTVDPVTTELQTELLAVIYLRFVRQLGFYLIEMNSGRLRGGAEAYRRAFQSTSPEAQPLAAGTSPRPAMKPVTIALVGQVSSGKSSLVNALVGSHRAVVDILPATRDAQRYEFPIGDPPVAVTLLDTPGYAEGGATADQLQQIRSALQESNAVLVVMDSHSPARDADLRTIRELEAWYRGQPQLKPPPMLGVLTHIDLLKPSLEWSPPYNWRQPANVKEQSIHDAVDYVAGLFASSLTAVVAVCIDARPGRAWGVLEEVIPELTGLLDDAQSAALLTSFEEELDSDRLKTLLKQLQRLGRELLRCWIEERILPDRHDVRKSRVTPR